MGILPLFDPPREDSAETIAQAQAHGIQVKMVTGDNLAIAREIAGKLGLGRNIQNADQLLSEDRLRPTTIWPPAPKRPTASPRSFPSTSSGSSRRSRTRAISSA
jgi:magnesium-transporting ATPase (P-type)